MADYYAILNRAVSGLSAGSREQRQAVYDKARKALLSQLQNMDPPLAPADISKQRMALEEAVRAVERDLTIKSSAEGVPEKDAVQKPPAPASAPQPRSEAGVASRSSAAVPVSKQSPQPRLGPDKPVAEQPAVAKIPPVPAQQVPGSEAEQRPAEKIVAPADKASKTDKVVRRAGQDVLKNAVRDAKALGAATDAAVKSAQETAEIVGEQRNSSDAARIEPTLGDTVIAESKVYQRSSADHAGPVVGDQAYPNQASYEEEEQNKSGFGLFVALFFLVLVVGGGAYLLFQNKEAFLGESADSADTDAGKVANGGEAGSSQTPDSTSSEIPAKTVRTVTVKPSDSEGAATIGEPALLANNADNEKPVSDQSQSTVDNTSPQASDPANDTQPAPASRGDAGLVVAQRAILYEENGTQGSAGTASTGETIWSLQGEGKDAWIEILVSIPDQGLTASIKISRNADAELPASHLIEVSAIRAANAGKRVIKQIPGLILKPTEQSRGQGLVGVAMRISDDLHWIALTEGERERAYNLELLQLRSWIDMPILYESGKRAILTLEKGNSGDKVIAKAIEAWK